MTDITDQDRRAARQWATNVSEQGKSPNLPLATAARVILATVEAPEPTLAEELRAEAPGVSGYDLAGVADLVEQIEQERDEARAELDQWKQVSRIETTTLREQRDEAQDEVIRQREIIRKHKEQTDRAVGERDEARAEVERLKAINHTPQPPHRRGLHS